MENTNEQMKKLWDESFEEQIKSQAYNTAAVEALVRNVAYYLRSARPDGNYSGMHFMEAGCGAGPNLIWLAQKGIKVSGVDISPTALKLCEQNMKKAGLEHMLVELKEASVDDLPFEDASFDGILEACVFQHIDKECRKRTYNEVGRTLKKGGLFCGYMLGNGHSVYQQKKSQSLPEDPGTIIMDDGKSKFYLTNIGLSHFYSKEEYSELLEGFDIIDPLLTEYYLPKAEAKKRGYDEYKQSMWTVYAVK